jgi:hypothetical protein
MRRPGKTVLIYGPLPGTLPRPLRKMNSTKRLKPSRKERGSDENREE